MHRDSKGIWTTSLRSPAWEFEKISRSFALQVTGPLTFNDPQLMLDAAVEGLGVAYVLEDKAAGFVTSGQLVRIFEDWTPPFPGFYLYYPSRVQVRPVLAAFIAAARVATVALP